MPDGHPGAASALSLRKMGAETAATMIQSRGATSRSGGKVLLLAPLVPRARSAYALVPVGEVLAEARSDLGATRRVAVDLEEAKNRREAPQKAEAGALGMARGIGIVADVGVLGVAGDLVLDDGVTGGVQGFLGNLLGELVEQVMHGEMAWRRRQRDLLSPSWSPAEIRFCTSGATWNHRGK